MRKMSAFPAQRIGLADRGVLREGMKADIAIFDPGDGPRLATFERPHQYAEGVGLRDRQRAGRVRERQDDARRVPAASCSGRAKRLSCRARGLHFSDTVLR